MRWWRELKTIARGELSFAELTHPGAAWRHTRRMVVLLRETFIATRRVNLALLANALAYKTLAALIPTLAIFLAVSSLTGHGDALIAALRETLPDDPAMARALASLRAFADSAWYVAGGGVALLLWTAFSLLLAIEDAFNRIWRARPRRAWLGRLAAYLSTLILVPILLSASVVVTGVATRTAEGVEAGAGRFIDWVREFGFHSAQDDGSAGDADDAPTVDGGAPPAAPEAAETGETVELIESVESVDSPAPGRRYRPSATGVMADSPDGGGARKPELSARSARPGRHGARAASAVRAAEAAKAAETPPRSAFTRVVLALTSALLTITGLTAFHYLLPDTTVRLRAALCGGLLSGIAFEASKAGFRWYIRWAAGSLETVYGPMLALPLFLIWLWLVWWLALLGAELAFVTQNFSDLAHRFDRERRGADERAYLAVRTMLAAARRFRDGLDPEDLPDDAARELSVPAYLTRALAEELSAKGLLRRVQDRENGFVPGRDPARLTVAMVARAVGGLDLSVPGARDAHVPDDAPRRRLAEAFGRASEAYDAWLGMDFATLLAEESAAKAERPALPPP